MALRYTVLRHDTGRRTAAKVRRFLRDPVLLAATYIAIDGAALHGFSDRSIVRLLLSEEIIALRFGSGSRSPGAKGSGVVQRIASLKGKVRNPEANVPFGDSPAAHWVAPEDLMIIVVEYDQPAALELFFWKEHCRAYGRRPLGNPDAPRRTSSRCRTRWRPVSWNSILSPYQCRCQS